jgi:thymidylate synthase (FAD)
MKVTYIDHMGSDLTVVNAARVSFHREHKVFNEDKDEKLIRYLAEHKHESPFAHPHLMLHFKAPIFVARQLVKHQVGFVWNEVSRRYVDTEPEVYYPEYYRKRSKDKKQGSEGRFYDEEHFGIDALFYEKCERDLEVYNTAISLGVAPEQARMVLPQNTYTEWYWTGSLLGWARVINLRCKPDAQEETRQVVQQVIPILGEYFPVSTKYLLHKDVIYA